MKTKKIFLIFILVFSILLSSFSFYVYQVVKTPNLLVGKEDSYLLIPTGATFKSVQDSLYDKNYVQDLVAFSLVAKFMNYDEQVKPGLYLLKKDMTNLEAIRLLNLGQQAAVNVTFHNIRLKSELAEKITNNLEMDASDFEKLLFDSSQAALYNFEPETFLTMFIPNTYEVYWNVSPEKLMERMHVEYEKFWTAERLAKAEKLDLTPVEVSVLASIVQAESIKTDESPTIAGVYLNRLDRGIALQADPTLVFAAGDFTIRRVLNVHKEIDSPYNTYKYAGLPPGPINLPSIASIDAVLNYQDHNYIYFCAKADFSGYHAFASSLTEHLRNARKYQQALNEANLYR